MADIIDAKTGEIVQDIVGRGELPDVPDDWDYDKSVKKVRGFVYKWKNMTEDILRELYIAREKLRTKGGRPKKHVANATSLSGDDNE